MTVLSNIVTGLNVLANSISLGNLKNNFTTDNLTSKFSVEEQQRLADQFGTSLRFDAKQLPAMFDSFDKYISTRISTIDGFNAIKTPQNKTIAELLNAKTGSDVDAIKTAISTVFQAPTIADDFETQKEQIQAIVHSGKKFNPHRIISRLQIMHSEACETFEKQHTKETKEIENLFADPTFKNKLKNTLALSSDQDLDSVKKEMLKQLDASHAEHLKTYKEAMEKQITQIHKAAQLERDRVFWMATLYENVPAMRKQIDDKIKEKKQGSSGVVLNLDGAQPHAIFSGIDIQDLDITSLTGNKVKQLPTGEISMQLSNRIWGFRYWHSSDNNLLVDAKLIVALLKTDKITLSVNHGDPKQAIVAGRALYQAAMESGRDPKNVTIVVNGEAIKADQIQEKLFKDEPQAYQMSQQKASKSKEDRQAMAKQMTAQGTPGQKAIPTDADRRFEQEVLKGDINTLKKRLTTHLAQEEKKLGPSTKSSKS